VVENFGRECNVDMESVGNILRLTLLNYEKRLLTIPAFGAVLILLYLFLFCDLQPRVFEIKTSKSRPTTCRCNRFPLGKFREKTKSISAFDKIPPRGKFPKFLEKNMLGKTKSISAGNREMVFSRDFIYFFVISSSTERVKKAGKTVKFGRFGALSIITRHENTIRQKFPPPPRHVGGEF